MSVKPNSSSHFEKDPSIRVLITGLQVLRFPRPEYCVVNVLKAPAHEFSIFVEEISRNTGIVSRKTFSNLKSREFSLEIFENGRWVNPRVSRFVRDPFDQDSLEREAFQEFVDSSIAGSDDPRDYRWAVDFTSQHFYPDQEDPFDPDNFAPKVYLNRGQFYTAARTTQSFDRVTIRRRVRSAPPIAAMFAGSQYSGPTQYPERKTIGRVARVIGANIKLEHNEVAYLTIRECHHGEDRPQYPPGADPCPSPPPEGQTLIKFDTCNHYYKVALVNLHPLGGESAPAASDFLEYGNAFKKANGFDRVDVYDLEPTSRSYSDRIPCTPINGH